MLKVLMMSVAMVGAAGAAEKPKAITCEKSYPYHLQGVATDGTNIYWSFTTVLAKTDGRGKVIAEFDTGEDSGGGHLGDICFHNGEIIVGVNRWEAGGARQGDEVWVLDAATMELKRKYPTPQTVFCNNGVEWYEGCYFVIGSSPYHHEYNYVWQFTEDFRLKRVMPIKSGWTQVGVQTICYLKSKGMMAFGYYGNMEDKEMPHAAGTFLVKAADLVAPSGAAKWIPPSEAAPVLEVAGREKWDTACGMLELRGAIFRAQTWSKGEGKAKRWLAAIEPIEKKTER